MLGLRSIGLVSIVLTICSGMGCEQVSADQPTQPLQMFLDHVPAEADRAKVPATAKDIVVAKVRIVDGPSWIGGRDQGGLPSPAVTDTRWARVQLVHVFEGIRRVGDKFDLYFASPKLTNRYIVPHTPAQLAKEYYIISYIDDDSRRRLVHIPADEAQFTKWYNEYWTYERERSRPGRAGQ